MSKKMTLATGAVLVAAAMLFSPASDATVLGAAYLNNAAAGNAVIGFPHGAPDVTFTVPSPTNPSCTGIFAGDTLCFDSVTTGQYTVGGFLATGGATILTGSAAALAATFNSTVLEFAGTVTVTTGESFTVAHDDGLQLLIGGDLVIDRPGPTAPTITTDIYTGPSGTFSFDLVYGECCGPPARLAISLPLESAPEPMSLALIASGLMGLAAVRRRR